MFVEIIALQLLASEVFCSGDVAETRRGSTFAVERLVHVPLGAWIKEGQSVAFLDTDEISLLVSSWGNTNFNDGGVAVGLDVEFDAGLTAVVDIEKVTVQFDVLGFGHLDA